MAQQPYIAAPPGFCTFETTLPSTLTPSALTAGTGSPEGMVPAVPGQQYVDLNTQNQWTKMKGVGVWGWQLTGRLATYLQVVAAPS